MTKPVENVIKRELPKDIEPKIKLYVELLEEAVNYGSHIIVKGEKPENNGEENLFPLMLFRQYLDLLDSISILIKGGTGDPAKIIMRAMLEVNLYIQYLFEKDFKRRSLSFLVVDLIKQINTLKKINPTSEEGLQFYKLFDKEIDRERLAKESGFIEHLKGKERLLESPRYKEIVEEYYRLKKLKVKNISWYTLFTGHRSIEALAKHLGQEALYEIIYRQWSGAVHSTDIYLRKVLKAIGEKGEDMVHAIPLRNVQDIPSLVQWSLTLTYTVYRVYINSKAPEMIEGFRLWYVEMKEKQKNLQ